jgi:hypothetical protein
MFLKISTKHFIDISTDIRKQKIYLFPFPLFMSFLELTSVKHPEHKKRYVLPWADRGYPTVGIFGLRNVHL